MWQRRHFFVDSELFQAHLHEIHSSGGIGTTNCMRCPTCFHSAQSPLRQDSLRYFLPVWHYQMGLYQIKCTVKLKEASNCWKTQTEENCPMHKLIGREGTDWQGFLHMVVTMLYYITYIMLSEFAYLPMIKKCKYINRN